MTTPLLQCYSCSKTYPINASIWKCPCGGVLDVRGTTLFPRGELSQRPCNLWRYRESLALPTDDFPQISLGEVMTPLLTTKFRGWNVTLKLEYLLPTGSYKDRGVAVCINHLTAYGKVSAVAEDSSGNAGASTAAYAAAAGIRADIYVPASTSTAKTHQIRLYGAQCKLVPGTRTDSAAAAQDARNTGEQEVQYIGHSYNPFFACGIKSVAYELAEQSNWHPPDWIVTPVGGGSLVLGLIDGFAELLLGGYISKLPRILAVQAAACAPIHAAWLRGDEHILGINGTQQHKTYAEGVALPNPARGNQVLRAIRHCDGKMIAVDDTELLATWGDMARKGISMEPTSAVGVAGAWMAKERNWIRAEESVVILVTGHGLKTSPTLLGEE